MTTKADRHETLNSARPTEKKIWEAPAIMIERSLVAEAQEPDPVTPPFMGGLLGSGVGG